MTDGASHRTARRVAVLAGLLGTLLALATPLLPVTQRTAELTWPVDGVFGSVEAPLIGYVATDLTVTVPCAAAAGLTGNASVLLSTVPKQAPNAVDRGMLVERTGDSLTVVVRNTPVVTAPLADVLGPDCRELTISARADRVAAEFVGLTAVASGDDAAAAPGPLRGERSGYDFRPQIVGVFTDLTGPAPPGLSLNADLDTRYSSSPTLLKVLAMVFGVAATVVSLLALHRLDTADGMRHRRLLPSRWWTVRPLDAVVAAVLVWWHFVGANTADDGYILTMARVSPDAGYMANYYRWFGTPEAPFGWYYDLLALWAQVSTASIWLRLPTLLMALACWWIISREVIPRLGASVRSSRAAAVTAAGLFLAVWLPLNNGLRPEPIIALGILLTWCSVERGVATSRLLPVALACTLGALTLFSGPTGIASVGALLVAIGPLRTIVARRSRRFGYAALLTPILAAGSVTLILIFRDQTFAGEVQANALKSAIGPSLAWFDEHIRYERLFTSSPDGSVARRFAVLSMLLALAVTLAMTLRKGRVPGTAKGPALRIVGITVICFLAMMFTPTKWTHHFGVLAGLAGPLGALFAVSVSAAAMRSARNRAVVTALVLFATALCFATVNGWWYVSNFGVPWSNAFPQVRFGVSTYLLGATVLALLVAGWAHFVRPGDGRRRRFAIPPPAVAAWALVAFQVGSLTAATVAQYPAWSVGRSNLEALTGGRCGLADDVLVEADTNAGLLTPLAGPPTAALAAGLSRGFTADGLPSDLSADPAGASADAGGGAGAFVAGDTDAPAGGSDTDGSGGAGGSATARARLPFGLDPARTPVLGSYRAGPQRQAELRSGWYRLPARDGTRRPLLVIAAAGRFDPPEVRVQWATDAQARRDEAGGAVTLADVGAAPAWRNLRVPVDALPDEATLVRIVASDEDLAPQHWIALTPPRVPELRTLQDVVGSTDPVLLDWLVGLAFPCQRPFSHVDGVIETPRWRILPDRFGADANSPVMDNIGGGPLGITELLLRTTTVPSYLDQDWTRDWGSLQRLTPYAPQARAARLDVGTSVESGWWSPGPLRQER